LPKENDVLCVSRARITSIEFTIEGDSPVKVSKGSRSSFSVNPENEIQLMDAAIEAYRRRRAVEVYEDRRGRIVKIQPTETP
jgi:hypothetical protein